jgi:hypothetical protein
MLGAVAFALAVKLVVSTVLPQPASDRQEAQAALNALQPTNIPRQLVKLTRAARLPPAACRVHVRSRSPRLFDVYIFWTPYIGPAPYTWLTMSLGKDTSKDTFHLGAALPALPGGMLAPDGKSLVPGSDDYDSPLTEYGRQQETKNRQVLLAHAGEAFRAPSARCEILVNGYLRLAPAT